MRADLIAFGLLLACIGVLTAFLWFEKRTTADLREKLTTAERQIETLKVNREVLTKLDRDTREVGRQVDDAVRRSETITDAIDAIEAMEGR